MKKSRKRLYEGMYILSSTLSEEARKKALLKIQDGITQKKGEVNKIHDMGKQKFAYEIGGKKEGFYYLLYFTIESLQIIELVKDYKLNEDLLRFMTMQTKEVKETLEFKKLKN